LTRRQALLEGATRLRAAGIETARLEARLLLSRALAIAPETLLAEPDCQVETSDYRRLLERRAAREPLAMILGHREFWSLDFAVSNATLIPRPESETVIEAARALYADGAHPNRILDLGTGTGCLLLAALREFPSAFGLGIENRPDAVALARRNAAMLGFGGRTAFLVADWAAPLSTRFDLVLANPPYIPSKDIERLMPEVALHEPRSALDGGSDGLRAYRAIIPTLQDVLAPSGTAILEIGVGQSDAVAALANSAGFTTSLRQDLGGTPRAIALRNRLAHEKTVWQSGCGSLAS
jgi:release factor glutamine methyltransferase